MALQSQSSELPSKSQTARRRAQPQTTDPVAKILVVDDHRPNLLALEAVLEPLGHTIVSVLSGEEAILQLEREDFAVVLLDVQMKGLNGFATAARIKLIERARHTPLVFISASPDDTYVTDAYATGGVDYVVKPFNPTILRAKVAVFVDLFQKTERIRRQDNELRASLLLSSSLDYETTLRNMGLLVVPMLADWYAIDLTNPDGTLQRAAIQHVDPEKIALAQELNQRYPTDMSSPHGVAKVIRTGESDWMAHIPDELLVAGARDEEHLRLSRDLGLKSYICVPLIARGQTLGAMTLVMAESGRVYDTSHLHAAQDLAARAALSIDNARLHRQTVQAEEKLRSIFAQAPVAIAVTRGPQHLFESSNVLYSQLVSRDAVGKTVRAAFPEFEGQPFYALMDQVYSTGKPYVGSEIPMKLRRHGAQVEEDCYFTFLYQPLNNPRGIMTLAVEVTEQVRARERLEALTRELQRSEAQFRSMAEAIPQQVWTATPEGALDFVNARVTTYFGKPAEELLGNGWTDGVHPDEVNSAGERWAESLATGKAYATEFRLRSVGGNYRWHLAQALPLLDAAGKVTQWFGSNTDIHDLKMIGQERERLIGALERSNRELDQFAYVASHDLKAPLRGISNLSQWIEEDLTDKLTEEGREQMGLLRGRVHRLEGLIDGILSYSRAGRIRQKPESVAIAKLVNDIRELLDPEPGIAFDLQANLPTLLTERIPLQQVFMNLIGNAIKHASRADLVIAISALDVGPFYEFAVKDNGRGVSPEYHEKIWGIFQTLQSRDKVEGTGIGLAVIRKIVESKGGRSWIESSEGNGATFKFTWPKKVHSEGESA